MEANFDIFFADLENIRGIGRAHFLHVAQHESDAVSVRQLFDFRESSGGISQGSQVLDERHDLFAEALHLFLLVEDGV